jgi:alpha-glucosidase
MWPEAPPSTAGFHPESIELHVFVPEVDGTYLSTLPEDDGITFDVQSGACFRTLFELTRAGPQLTLRASVEGNGYHEFARQRFDVVIHGGVVESLVVDGGERSFDAYPVVLDNDGKSFVLEVRLSS